MTDVVIGVDVGTTRVKAIAVGLTGAVCGEAHRPTPWLHFSGRTEVDPLELSTLASTVAASAASKVDGARVRGIGITGMAETGVLVDATDRPLAPAIAWHDPRGDLDTIVREIGTEIFQASTGLPLTPLPSLGKLLWLRRHVAETKGAVRFYSVGEWVVRRLGGAAVTELSLASRTGLLELSQARPWDAAFALLDWPPLLGDLVVAGTPAGTAQGDGVPAVLDGAVLTVAGHDHQTASYGVGAATDGALFDSLGTAEGLVRTVGTPVPAADVGELAGLGMSVGWAVVSGHMSILAGVPTGLTLNRVAAMVGATSAADRARLGEQALTVDRGWPAPRLVDLRYEKFGIADITDGMSPAVLWRSAVDGLVAESERALARIDAVVGPYRRVVVGGGWLHNPAVLAAKRRQYPAMRTTEIAEPGAYGAALMAAGAAGVPVTGFNER